MASQCVQNNNSHPLHHRKGIRMLKKTASDRTNCRLLLSLQNPGGCFKHRGMNPFLHHHPNQKPICHSQPPSSTLQCLLGHGLSCSELIWILQHICSARPCKVTNVLSMHNHNHFGGLDQRHTQQRH